MAQTWRRCVEEHEANGRVSDAARVRGLLRRVKDREYGVGRQPDKARTNRALHEHAVCSLCVRQCNPIATASTSLPSLSHQNRTHRFTSGCKWQAHAYRRCPQTTAARLRSASAIPSTSCTRPGFFAGVSGARWREWCVVAPVVLARVSLVSEKVRNCSFGICNQNHKHIKSPQWTPVMATLRLHAALAPWA